jgi:hypothetical protein
MAVCRVARQTAIEQSIFGDYTSIALRAGIFERTLLSGGRRRQGKNEGALKKMNLWKPVLVGVIVIGISSESAMAVMPADWSSVSSATLNGSTITMSGMSFGSIVVDQYPFGTAAFAGLPLPTNSEMLEYSSGDNWTATFSPPINGVYLYLDLWRGEQKEGADPPATYSFDRPFSVATGLSGAIVGTDFVTLPETGGTSGFHSGAIFFSGSISSLSVVRTGQTVNGLQVLTFAVPEPAGMVLIGAGLVVSAGLRRRGYGIRA